MALRRLVKFELWGFLLLLTGAMAGCRHSGNVKCPPARCPVGDSKTARVSLESSKEEGAESESSQSDFHSKRHGLFAGKGAGLRSVSLSPEGRYMAVGGAYGTLEIRRLADGRLLQRLGETSELVEGLLVRFSKEGKLLASAGHDLNRVRVWDPDTGKLLREWESSSRRISSLGLTGDDILLVGGEKGRVEAYALSSGSKEGQFQMEYEQEIASLDGDSNGSFAAAADLSGQVEIYNLKNRQRVGRVTSRKRLAGLAVSPGGEKLALALSSGVVRFHNLPFGDRDESTALRLKGRVQSLRFSPRGDLLAVALQDSSVELFRTNSGERIQKVKGRGAPVLDLTFGQNGHVLAAVEKNLGVHIWWHKDSDIKIEIKQKELEPQRTGGKVSPKVPEMLKKHKTTVIHEVPFAISRIAIDRRGRFVAASGLPEKAAVWHSQSGKLSWYAEEAPGHVTYREHKDLPAESRPVMLAFDPRNSRLYAFGKSNRIYRWNARTGRYIRFLLNPKGTMRGLLFAEDGGSFLTLLKGGVVRHYSTTGKLIRNFKTPQDSYWIGLCPTGELFATVQGWDAVSTYSVKTGKQLWKKPSGRLKRYVVQGVKFDGGCKHLMTYHDTGFVRVYDARSGDLVSRHMLSFSGKAVNCVIHKGRSWVACSLGRKVEFRDITTGGKLLELKVPVGVPGEVRDLQMNLKEDTLLAQVGERSLVVWHFNEGESDHDPDGDNENKKQKSVQGKEPEVRTPKVTGPGRDPKLPKIHFPSKKLRRRLNMPTLKQKKFNTEDEKKPSNKSEGGAKVLKKSLESSNGEK